MPSSYALGEHVEKLMTDLIKAGRYQSKSEIIRDGLRAIEDRERLRELKLQDLRAAIQAGIDSGPGIPAEEVFADMRARITAKIQ